MLLVAPSTHSVQSTRSPLRPSCTHNAGIKVVIPDPGPVEGYVEFMARSLLRQYDIDCEGSLTAGRCSLQMGLEVGRSALCTASPSLPKGGGTHCCGFSMAAR